MSTPTTAVATLPPFHPHHYPHPHPPHLHPHSSYVHSHHQGQPAVSANYRPTSSHSSATKVTDTSTGSSTNHASLPSLYSASTTTTSVAETCSTPTSTRLPPFYPSQNLYSSPSDGVTQKPPRPPPHAHQSQHQAQGEYLLDSASRQNSQQDAHYTGSNMHSQPAKKRRRSHGPDWKEFYRNGLPSEIIVIDDDTPEPDASAKQTSAPNRAAVIEQNTNKKTASINSPNGQTTRKRRRDEDPKTAPGTSGYHIRYINGHSASSATISSDRTTSALNSTAPTSLSSQSQHEESQLPLKRKRTRQQVANEAKRRDTDVLGNRCFTYKPPPFPPKKAPDVRVKVIHDPPSQRNQTVDDDDGHYIVVPDAGLTEKYQIVRLLGQGTFGKVVKAYDRGRNKHVAVKIIRSVQKYRDASKIELRVLATLKMNDEENRNRCIHLRDCFDYRNHICIVMDLLDQSVFDFLKGNGFVPFPNSQIQSFARQLFTSVAFLHDLNLIHTDLKPENILLCDQSYQTFTYSRRIPSSSTTVNRSATQRRVLLDTEIRLIDFGSATFEDEYHSSVVSTRHYRAPEIILGLGWSFPCDIWSIGCILVEFFTGDALFQTHDNLEHLAMMEAVIGRRIDSYLVQNVNKMSGRNGANSASKYFKRLKLDYPNTETTRGSRRFVKAMKHLDDIIPQTNTFMKNFRDLLKKIFVYDPAQRITAKDALNHEWFKEMAYNDDGTEAAKIRLERKMREQQGLSVPAYH
ncbi:unnamed protein product [Clonostachys solani]|uniref:dual-specificity kinase n=1 Tax=Clonostachys solani TaxID=160281 RepID=A0A9P0EGP0_9HYPO|nr:unnamed protein product [Clonostachys solani]